MRVSLCFEREQRRVLKGIRKIINFITIQQITDPSEREGINERKKKNEKRTKLATISLNELFMAR
jgi:hypothetical protein